MSEFKKITGIISEELDEALNESARNKNKKKLPYIGEIIEKYLKEENSNGRKKESSKKESSKEKVN